MESENKTAPEEMPENKVHPARPGRPALTWVGVALALGAWLALMTASGYIALGIGVAAAVMSIWGIAANGGALRKVAVAALIAALVLVIVLVSFLIVIRIGLS